MGNRNQKLLEGAAKASGVGPILCYESARNCLRIGDRKSYSLWQPLTDDGDALRLAVTLRIEITQSSVVDENRWVSASRWGHAGREFPVVINERVMDESERQSVTRWCIVRAAYEIGSVIP